MPHPNDNREHGSTQWTHRWQDRLTHAQLRSAMYIGEQKFAHRSVANEALSLTFKTKIFGPDISASVHLSPTQYVVQCCGGSLLRTVEESFTWQGKRILMGGWEQKIQELRASYEEGGFAGRQKLSGWRRYFGSPTGPTLDSPLRALPLSNRFACAYKTSKGYWTQIFEGGWPKTDPVLITEVSTVSFLVVAKLDPHWFTGLPFTQEDAKKLGSFPNVISTWNSDDAELKTGFNTSIDLSFLVVAQSTALG